MCAPKGGDRFDPRDITWRTDVWKLYFKNIFWPHDLLMQPIRTVGTTSDQLEIITVKFDQNPMCSLIGEDD